MTSGPTDLELLQGVARGCERSFSQLFHRWAPRLGDFLTRTTGSREVAEDLVQETFLRILRAAPAYRPHGSASAWIYRIAVNLAYSHWRKRKHAPALSALPSEQHPRARTPDSDGPEATRLRREFLRDLEDATRRLPANQRMVFQLKIGQGLTYGEIAAVLGCPEGTAKSRFHHAVRKLRAELREWDGAAMREPDDATRSPHSDGRRSGPGSERIPRERRFNG